MGSSKRRTKVAYLILYLFLYPIVLIAQKPSNPLNTDSTAFLKEVVVTATKRATSLLKLPYSVNRVTDSSIQNFQFRTTPEALMGETGLFVQKTNHAGGSIFVRGLTGNQNLLLVDGIRLNNSLTRYGPNQYLNTIDVYSIATIEVVRGTGSVQNGSDALGGVIQVFTKGLDFSDKPTTTASFYGKAITADMEFTGRAEFGIQRKNWSILGGLTNRKFGDLIGGDTTGIQSPSGYKQQDLDLKFRWGINKDILITAAHQQTIQKDVPLYHRVKLENFDYYYFSPQKRMLNYIQAAITGNNKLFNKTTITGSLQINKEQRNYQRNGNPFKFEEVDKIITKGLTVDISSVFNKNWTANTGIEYYHDKVESSKMQIALVNNNPVMQRGLYPNNATSSNFSVFTMHHIQSNRFLFELGARYNALAIGIKDTSGASLQLGSIKVKPSSFVVNFSLLYQINGQQSIYGSFSTGYRAPNIDDMGTLGLVDFRYEVPAYDLKPEKSYNTEIGYKIITNKLKTSMAFFHMDLQQLINRVQVPGQQIGGYSIFTKVNNQTSFIQGFEYELQVKFAPRFSASGNISYAFGQNITVDEPMRRIPPINGNFHLMYTTKSWNMKLEYLAAGAQTRLAQGDKSDNRIPKGGTPNWTIFNLYYNYFYKSASIHIGMGNLFNQDYRMHGSGINGIGRHVYAGFKINI